MWEIPDGEAVFKRAYKETEKFRNSAKSFWSFEIVGAAMLGLGGAYAGYLLMPAQPSSFQQFAYPGFGGTVGIIFGLVIVFVSIFLWNLFRAPYRQRDEARQRCYKLQIEFESQKQIEAQMDKIRTDIGYLIIDGTKVLKGFESVKTLEQAWPVEEFKEWQENCSRILLHYRLNDVYPLWFRDTSIIVNNPLLVDFVQACNAGLNRLETLLKRLSR